jgi:hypothetical protein
MSVAKTDAHRSTTKGGVIAMMNVQFQFLHTLSPAPRWDVLATLLTQSEGKVERVEETRTGFVEAHSIPGVMKSGAMYVYDEQSKGVFLVSFDGRDTDLSRAEIDTLLPQIVDFLNTPDTPNQNRRRRHHRRHHHVNQAVYERKVIPFPIQQPVAA